MAKTTTRKPGSSKPPSIASDNVTLAVVAAVEAVRQLAEPRFEEAQQASIQLGQALSEQGERIDTLEEKLENALAGPPSLDQLVKQVVQQEKPKWGKFS